MNKRVLIFLFCGLSLPAVSCANMEDAGINFVLGGAWGKPKYSSYTSVNKVQEWRYTQKDATLIVTKTECPKCRPLTKADADQYNDDPSLATTAVLIDHGGKPAMYRLHPSPKGVNLRTFLLHVGGHAYEIQLGINDSASQALSFRLEKEFLALINSLNVKAVDGVSK